MIIYKTQPNACPFSYFTDSDFIEILALFLDERMR